ncbi:MAG: hypothetical protein ACT4PE_05535 [Candidatus Eiseniibacteriota bacterium]
MATMVDVRHRVREHLRDTDFRRPEWDTAALDNAIAEAYMALAAWLPAPTAVVESAGTIAANADTFTLPTAAGEEYAGEVRIRLRSDGSFLIQRTVEEIDMLRAGETSTVGTTRPTHFCMWEELDQDVICRCWPRSRDAEAYDIHRTLALADLREGASLDIETVRFSRFGVSSLVLHAAASLVTGATDEALSRLGLSRGAARTWQQQSDILLYKERERRHNVESVGRVMRLVR